MGFEPAPSLLALKEPGLLTACEFKRAHFFVGVHQPNSQRAVGPSSILRWMTSFRLALTGWAAAFSDVTSPKVEFPLFIDRERSLDGAVRTIIFDGSRLALNADPNMRASPSSVGYEPHFSISRNRWEDQNE
jgi:hypothetical protein